MLEKIRRFMTGRYGLDEAGRFIFIVSAILMIVSTFTKNSVLYLISVILLILYGYRIISKNYQRRYKENAIYLQYKNKILASINKIKYNIGQRKVYHIYKCPSCKQKIRIPKGKGKVTITCPKCKTEFNQRS